MVAAALFSVLASMFAGELPALAVIPVIVSEGEPAIGAAAIADEVAAAARGRPIRVLTHEDLFVDANSELVDEVRACGADEVCMSSRLSVVRAQLGAIVLVNSIADPPIVAVRMVDVREKRVVASAIGPLAAGERTIVDAVRSRVARLLEERGFMKPAIAMPLPALAPAAVQESSVIESPWFWAVIGAAVVLGISAAIVVSRPSECICVGPREDCPPC